MRDIEIVQFGKRIDGKPTYFVRCGCETFVFLSKEEVKLFVNDYINDPDGTERRYYAQFEKTGQETPTQGVGIEMNRPEGLGNTLRRR